MSVSPPSAPQRRSPPPSQVDQAQHLRLVLRAGGFGSWVWDKAAGTVAWDAELEAVFGLAPGAFPGTYEAWKAMLHPDDRDDVVARVEDAVARLSTYEIRHRVVWPDHSVHWVEGLGQVTVNASGEATGTIGCTRDVTASALVDEALAEAVAVARRTAAQANLLQSVTAELAVAMSVNDVAHTLAAQGEGLLGATAAAVALLSRQGDTMGVVASFGFGADAEQTYRKVQVSAATPMTECARTGSPVSVLVADLDLRYPGLAESAQGTGHTLLLALPLGVPGRRLGSLLLAYSGRTEISEPELRFVSSVAGQCSQALERARLVDRLAEVAETLQSGLAPHEVPEVAGFELAAVYAPGGDEMEQLGGDWFDVIPTPDGSVTLVVGDVMGRGVSSATTMTRVRTAARAYSWVDPTPAVVMGKLDDFVRREAPDDFITMVYATLRPETGDLTVVNAGHLPCVLVSAAGEAALLKTTTGLPLGLEFDARRSDAARLTAGDSLLLFTDGLVERRNRDIEQGLIALRSAAAAVAGAGALPSRLDELVRDLTWDQEPGDDVTALLLRRRGAP
jgi:serine phosphatase RsbU (regulator of sigma subunit)